MKLMDDVIGKKYNRWTVLSFSHSKNYHKFYECQCECGNKSVLDIQSLKSGNSKSCGCLRKETTKGRSITHGMSNSRLNRIYRNMKTRCYNRNNQNYKRYGEVGIKMCDEWTGKGGFLRFSEWAFANGYKEGLTIDRINGCGDYEPSNCRWATYKEQANNISTNVRIAYKGEEHTIAEWSDITGINRRTIEERYKRKLPLEFVFSKCDLRYKNEVML